MRKSFLFFLVSILARFVQAQPQTDDSLQRIVNMHRGDKAEISALALLGRQQHDWKTAASYAERGLALARKINYPKGEADCLMVLEKIYAQQGNLSKAIQTVLDATAIYESLPDYTGATSAHAMLQALYREVGDNRTSLSHAFRSLQLAEKYNVIDVIIFPGHRWTPLLLAEIGQTYVLMNQLDSALYYTQMSIAKKELFNGSAWGFPVYLLATILNMQGDYKPALARYREAAMLSIKNKNPNDTLQVYSGMSTLFKNTGQVDSAIHYANLVTRGWDPPRSEPKNLLEAVSNLAQVYKKTGHKDSALKYTELRFTLKDSIFSAEKNREVQQIVYNAKLKEEEIKANQIRYKSRMQQYGFVVGMLILLLIAAFLWRSNRQKQKARIKIEHAYNELKITQSQLIQKEKMASLGELTAGIAHEIQNPLNFVNNFSQVNQELIGEMEDELEKGNVGEAKAIAKDLKANEEKISQHGRRADSIVKGMLQHSRISSGNKEPININQLSEEYLRLSYQGLRAKDKTFSATIETSFDKSIGDVEAVPQDIGRVLLNLFNNSFYAVTEKKKTLNGQYEPTVSVFTRKMNGNVEIGVKDNGTGISPEALRKIFQPFFTTKPTGEGTGLGLSLSYDIIKAHGGELKVESKEGEGSEFVVKLPVN